MNAIDAQNTNAVRKAITTSQPLIDMQGYSNPLFAAIGAENPDPEIVKLLLDAGANPNTILPYGGQTPLSMAIHQENVPIIKHLLDAGANTDLVFYVLNFTDSIKALLQAGLDPNLEDKDGKTLLMHAARFEDSELTQLLLEAGADPNKIAPHTGETALHSAAANNNIQTIQLLLNAKADPTVRDFSNRSVLDVATDEEVIKILQSANNKNNPKNSINMPQTYEEALQSDVVVNCADSDTHIPARFAPRLVNMVLGEGDDAASVFSKHLENFNIFVCFPEWLPAHSQTRKRFLENVQDVIQSGRRDKLLVVADFANAKHMEVFKRVFAERAKYILVEGHGMPMSYLDADAVLAPGGTYRNDHHNGRGIMIVDDIRMVLDPLENRKSLSNFQFINKFAGVSNDDLKKLIEPLQAAMKELKGITKIPVHVSYVFRPIQLGVVDKLEFKLMANVVGLMYDLAHNEYGPDMQAFIGTKGDRIVLEISKGNPVYRFER